jgi:neutral ceramidase
MRASLLLLLGYIAVFTLPIRSAHAADPEWSAGVASVRITPEKPVPLAGYAARTKPFEKVDLDIYAKAVALQDGQGHRAVLIAADLCTIPTDVAEPVRKRIAEKHRLEPAAVILNLSHTHSGPSVSLRPRSEGPTAQPDPADAAGTVEYTKWLQERLAAVADDAFARLQPATLARGAGAAHFAMNRREFTDRGVILGVNPRGLVDRSVPVLRIDGPDGKPRAIVFGYACHGTTNPSNHLGVSPDYPGFARDVIERHFPGAESLFVAGCGGDANPYPRLDLKDAPANGEALGNEVVRVAGGKLTPVHGPLSCALVTAQLPLETPDRTALQSIAQTSGQRKQDAQKMLAALDRGESLPTSHPAPVVAWQFGKELTLVALPNEVVVEYVPLIERAVGPLRLWVAAYCNEVVGYIPSKRVLTEGGYETRGLYTGSGWFTPAVEDALVRAAEAAAVQAGRPASKGP